ncbi:Uncharacterised protein [Budvicia aquatica]|uniref:Uncharacterized protein n=1 Tax=Budvicia aquatica TaxID=82979 RepID=A0A484ZMI2_9GAMM|nr:Uncharacterised protein [Budvicia aquatica]
MVTEPTPRLLLENDQAESKLQINVEELQSLASTDVDITVVNATAANALEVALFIFPRPNSEVTTHTPNALFQIIR